MNQLESYTYFETHSGLICYSYGPGARYDDDHMVCSVAAYISDTPTNRLQVSTGRYVGKFVYEGNEGDLDSTPQFTAAPVRVREDVRSRVRVDTKTGERLLVIPLSDVARVYERDTVFDALLRGDSRLGQRKEEATQKIVALFAEHGINRADVGLYGSLQCGVFVDTPVDAEVDIDIILYGTEHLSTLKKLVEQYGTNHNTVSKYAAIHEYEPWRIARTRRSSLSQLNLGGHVHTDIKIVRKAGDPLSFDFQTYEPESTDIEFEGRVVDDTEALSYPSIVRVDCGGKEYVVATRMYVYVGAAMQGDVVKVKGRKLLGQNVVLVANAREHYINCIQ